VTKPNNGWAGKPGVPLNPERERHHWILTPDGEDAVYLWRPAGECERGRWPSAWVHDVDDWDPREGIYLGPCLTPDEATALQAENARLRKVLQQTVMLFEEILDALNADPAETKLVLRKNGVEVKTVTAADCFESARAELEQTIPQAQAAP
jgi:hypothetical protein